MGNLFPYMRKTEPQEEFVQETTRRLDFAFNRTRELQKAAADRNKARKPTQFQPKFQVGDFLLLYEKAAKEGRLEEKTEEGKFVPIPKKIRNPLTGPYLMTRWVGDRYCVSINGNEKVYNVTRLVKHNVWDDAHMNTDIHEHALTPTHTHTQKQPESPPKAGELVVFPTTYNEQHKCVFGIGKIMEIKGPNDVLFQWLGNRPLSEASKPFQLGWVDPRDNKGYYSNKPMHHSHQPWTNRDTSTDLVLSEIIVKGDVLNADGRIGTAFRSKIEAAIGETITWGTG